MGRRRRQRLPQDPVRTTIETLGHDGRGVARVGDKVVLIHGALPGEDVIFRYTARKRRHDEGGVVEILSPSPDRVEPRCPHYAICGGCALQHMAPGAQVAAKQSTLEDNLAQLGQVSPESILPPLLGASTWGYRRKARLGVKYVARKGRVLVGFRERGSSLVADIGECHVLHTKVGMLLTSLSHMIDGLSIRDRLPQIEVAMDDARCILIFRVLEPCAPEDEQRLLAFAADHDLGVYLQEGGPDSVRPLGQPIELTYGLPAHDLTLGFMPGDFTQVNSDVNRQMIDRSVQLLRLSAADRVIDLFCGIGNFTLPLARHAGAVTGVEGDAGLVARARENAQRNRLSNTGFEVANLYEELGDARWLRQTFNKALLDPPRSGAREILGLLPRLGVDRLVYVSCYPGTLARDAGLLVREHGYRLLSAGVMDMFPHTSHVESIAVFERG